MESSCMDCGGMDGGGGMDSGGLDFVETSFGSEGAAGGASKFISPQEKEQYWQKWSQAGSRNPIYPLVIGFFLFVIAISAPHVLDYLQDQKLAQQEGEADQAATQGQEMAVTGSPAQTGGVPYALSNSGGIDLNRQMFHNRVYSNRPMTAPTQYPQAQSYAPAQGYPQVYPQAQGYPQPQAYPQGYPQPQAGIGAPIEYGTPLMQGVPQTRYRVYVNR